MPATGALSCSYRSAAHMSSLRLYEPRIHQYRDIVELYFDDAIRDHEVSLLTHDEEIDLAKRVEAGKKAESILHSCHFTNSQAVELKDAARTGREARSVLITSNLRLVIKVASWYRIKSIPLADLIQEGNIGLMKAVDKYDWRRGTRFSTYAVWWIRQSISRSLANDSRLIRVPVHAHQKLSSIARNKQRLYQKNGSEPTVIEIAKETGFSEATVQDLIRHLDPPASLEKPIDTPSGNSTSLAAIQEDPETSKLDEIVHHRLDLENLRSALSELNKQEQSILRQRFGLTGKRELSLRATAKVMGLSNRQVQGLQASAMKKLRKAF